MAKTLFFRWPIMWLIFVISSFLMAKPSLASDIRVTKVAKFLGSYNSPLAYYAYDFVTAADQNGLDYRLLPAISGVESTYGKFYLPGTFNAYGWGGGLIPFKSWPEGIEKISFALKTNYINRGARDVWQIGAIYCPPNAANWSAKVDYIMAKIEATDATAFVLAGPAELANLPLTI